MRKLTIVLVLGVLATFGTAEAKSVAVDCNDGKTIGKALEMNAGILEIVVSGDCAENVLIERDDVSIVAQAGSTLTATDDTVAAIVVQGAQNVSVTGLSISGGRHGVEVRRGAAVTLTAVTVNDNVRHGVLVIDHSSVNIAGGTFSGNGGDGLGVWAASSATMGGSIVADGNTRAGILVSGSSVAAIPPGSISLQNNGYGGLYLQLSANVQLSVPLDQAGSDEGIAVYLGSSLAMGAFETSGNGFSGVTVYHNSTFESNGGTVTVDGNLHGFWVEEDSSLVRTGTTNFLSNTDAALYAEDSNVRLRNATGSGNGGGFIARNCSMRIANSSPADLVDLSFGTRIEGGGNSNFTGVNCDGTVISQFDHPCGYAASSFRAPAAQSARRVRPGIRDKSRGGERLEP